MISTIFIPNYTHLDFRFLQEKSYFRKLLFTHRFIRSQHTHPIYNPIIFSSRSGAVAAPSMPAYKPNDGHYSKHEGFLFTFRPYSTCWNNGRTHIHIGTICLVEEQKELFVIRTFEIRLLRNSLLRIIWCFL